MWLSIVIHTAMCTRPGLPSAQSFWPSRDAGTDRPHALCVGVLAYLRQRDSYGEAKRQREKELCVKDANTVEAKARPGLCWDTLKGFQCQELAGVTL